MASVVVLGASGFVGRAVVAASDAGSLKAVCRTLPEGTNAADPRVRWVRADPLAGSSLDAVLNPDDVVINLVYDSEDAERNLPLTDAIASACRRRRIARLVHCSTAVVAGTAPHERVTETTPCRPQSAYEQTKLAIEDRFLRASQGGFDLAILRPTAIVGPGGQNLVKLARALQDGNSFVNYCRASVFGRRRMHLISVRDVAAALLHLTALRTRVESLYIASADRDPDNTFDRVEHILIRALGLRPRRVQPIASASVLLRPLLRAIGRSDTNPERVYESDRLMATGFAPVQSVGDAVREFGEALRRRAA